MKKEPKIFVIIVTYKGHPWYERCFTSLRNSEYPVQTIVIDNASNDGTVEYIRENFPEIHLIESKENLGFGRANNIGMRYALDHGCDYVFLLNQDAWIEPNTLSIMIPITEQHSECGIFSPLHIAADSDSINFIVYDDSIDLATPLLSDCYFNTLKDVYLCRYVNAAAWLMPRKTLETVGGFDPLFNMYGEDDQYLQRLKYFKLWCGIIPKTKITHDHPKDVSTPTQALPQTKLLNERLVRYLDILTPMSVSQWIIYYILRLLKALLKFNSKKVRYCYCEILFLIQNKKSISKSRCANKILGPTWLNEKI